MLYLIAVPLEDDPTFYPPADRRAKHIVICGVYSEDGAFLSRRCRLYALILSACMHAEWIYETLFI